jgi:hypothetical protein
MPRAMCEVARHSYLWWWPVTRRRRQRTAAAGRPRYREAGARPAWWTPWPHPIIMNGPVSEPYPAVSSEPVSNSSGRSYPIGIPQIIRAVLPVEIPLIWHGYLNGPSSRS